jgi:uncharacterized protein (TIGR00297 family)
LIFLSEPGNSISISQFAFGFILSLLISVFSYKIKFLTAGGSLATFVLALVIFSLGGWKWTIPILSFYIFSTLLSKIREQKNPSVNEYFEKSGSRDLYQVLANGGLGGILAVINFIFPDTVWYLAYSGVIAASCADTWATEFGTMARHRTYDILRFRSVEQGSSGGVSFTGFAGALSGALFISLISVLWVDNNIIDFILMITVAGFAATLVDSILGASLQVQYQCTICGRIIDKREHCESKTVRYRGIKFINNDLVNLCAGLSGGIIVYFLTCI